MVALWTASGLSVRLATVVTRHEAVAFEVFDVGNGREAILSSSGRTCHIVRLEDGTWTVDEDEHHRIFPNRGDAFDCVRELVGDPDLPPLSQK